MSPRPVLAPLQRWLQRAWWGDAYDADLLRATFSRHAQDISDHAGLARLFLRGLDDAFHPAFSAVYAKIEAYHPWHGGPERMEGAPDGWRLRASMGEVPAIDPGSLRLPLELEGVSVFTYDFKGEPIGLLLLGPKRSRRGYVDRDRRLVESLSQLLALRLYLLDTRSTERFLSRQVEVLQETKALQEQFLDLVSHELRTPVSIILAAINVLALEGSARATPLLETYFGRIHRNAEHLSLLLDDLLNASQLHSGHFTLNRKACSFSRLVKEVIEDLSPLASDKQHHLANRVPDGWSDVTGDPQRLAQVLRNLVINAIKHNPAGCAIQVSAQRTAGRLRVEVTDNGIGIRQEDIPMLFQRFSRLQRPDATEARGVGLGLFIARAIVEAHHGAIGVTSEVGRGSTFWFELPCMS